MDEFQQQRVKNASVIVFVFVVFLALYAFVLSGDEEGPQTSTTSTSTSTLLTTSSMGPETTSTTLPKYYPIHTHSSKNAEGTPPCEGQGRCEILEGLLERPPGPQELQVSGAGWYRGGTGCNATSHNACELRLPYAIQMWEDGQQINDWNAENGISCVNSGQTFSIDGGSKDYAFRSVSTTPNEGGECEALPFILHYRILCRSDEDCRIGDVCEENGECQQQTMSYYPTKTVASRRMTGDPFCAIQDAPFAHCQVVRRLRETPIVGSPINIAGGEVSSSGSWQARYCDPEKKESVVSVFQDGFDYAREKCIELESAPFMVTETMREFAVAGPTYWADSEGDWIEQEPIIVKYQHNCQGDSDCDVNDRCDSEYGICERVR